MIEVLMAFGNRHESTSLKKPEQYYLEVQCSEVNFNYSAVYSQVSIYVAVAHQTSPQHQTLKKPAQLVLS